MHSQFHNRKYKDSVVQAFHTQTAARCTFVLQINSQLAIAINKTCECTQACITSMQGRCRKVRIAANAVHVQPCQASCESVVCHKGFKRITYYLPSLLRAVPAKQLHAFQELLRHRVTSARLIDVFGTPAFVVTTVAGFQVRWSNCYLKHETPHCGGCACPTGGCAASALDAVSLHEPRAGVERCIRQVLSRRTCFEGGCRLSRGQLLSRLVRNHMQ